MRNRIYHIIFSQFQNNLTNIILVIFLYLALYFHPLKAQDVDFNKYFPFSPTISELSEGTDLDFGTITSGMGFESIDILNSKIIVITGLKYMDVFLSILAPTTLERVNRQNCTETPDNCAIPFTLQAAYANKGSDNTAQAQQITIDSGNSGYVRFRILERTSGPPGPPPNPYFEGFNQAAYEESAFIYLYGSINVGNVLPGTYSTSPNITLTISYD